MRRCEFHADREAKETIQHGGRSHHVCRPCARTLVPARQARYLRRQTEKVAAVKAEEKAEEKRQAAIAGEAEEKAEDAVEAEA